MESVITLLLVSTLAAATPVVFAAIGGTLSAQVNVFNVGLEGMMLTGAFAGFLVADRTGSALLGVVGGLLGGAGMALLLAVAVLAFNADEVVAGLGVNLGALGLTSVLATAIYGTQGSVQSDAAGSLGSLGSRDVPVVGPLLQGTNWMTLFAVLIVFVSMYVTYRTTLGLRMRAIGSNPESASAAGIRVTAYRYGAVIVSGALCGVGGSYLPLSGLSLFTDNMTSGIGYVALAAVLFGDGRPGRAALAAYLYGVTFAVGISLQRIGFPPELVQMLPWVATIVALGLAVRQRKIMPLATPELTPASAKGTS